MFSVKLKIMKKKIIFGVLLIGIAVAVFYFRDTRDMKEVAAEQEQSIDDVTEKTLNEGNDLFNDDVDFGDVEEAPLALDTTKAEK